MKYIVYKTTCLVNNKIYIGVQLNQDDPVMGINEIGMTIHQKL